MEQSNSNSDWNQEFLERQEYMKNNPCDYRSESQKQIDMLCDSIRRTGNDILVETKSGRIYVYLNGKESQNVDAVQIGVDLCISFLAGIWIGITNQKK
jgi:hypothetical protein